MLSTYTTTIANTSTQRYALYIHNYDRKYLHIKVCYQHTRLPSQVPPHKGMLSTYTTTITSTSTQRYAINIHNYHHKYLHTKVCSLHTRLPSQVPPHKGMLSTYTTTITSTSTQRYAINIHNYHVDSIPLCGGTCDGSRVCREHTFVWRYL